METKEIYVKFETEAKIKWLYIDDEKLSLIDGESQKITVTIGDIYSLSWFLKGAPRTAYSIEVVGADLKIEDKNIPKDKTKAKGSIWFKVSK
jgi:hypothetical protein